MQFWPLILVPLARPFVLVLCFWTGSASSPSQRLTLDKAPRRRIFSPSVTLPHWAIQISLLLVIYELDRLAFPRDFGVTFKKCQSRKVPMTTRNPPLSYVERYVMSFSHGGQLLTADCCDRSYGYTVGVYR